MTVYFIQDGGPDGPIKIGYTAGNPYTRLATFRTGNPRPLTLLVTIPGEQWDERALHKRFEALREGGEWFRADARLLGFIEGLRAAHPNQPEDPGPQDEWTLSGLTCDQVDALLATVRASEAVRAARRWGRTWSGYERIGDHVFDDGNRILTELEDLKSLAERDGGNAQSAYGIGICVGLGDELEADEDVDSLIKAIDRTLETALTTSCSDDTRSLITDKFERCIARNGGRMLLKSLCDEVAPIITKPDDRDHVLRTMTSPHGRFMAIEDGGIITLRERHVADHDRWVGFGWVDDDDRGTPIAKAGG